MNVLGFEKVILEKTSFNEKKNYYCIDHYIITDKSVMQCFKIYHNEEDKKEARYIKVGKDPIYSFLDRARVIESLEERGFVRC